MDKFELYQKAKEAYYNGDPIMGDAEFDELEKELGLENQGYIGTLRSPELTVEHPFLMGSLSKVQIHRDKKTRRIDWEKYLSEAKSYFGNNPIIVTPKYDGCSFEMLYHNIGGKWEVDTICGRGDGKYGKDLTPFLFNKAKKIEVQLNESNKFTSTSMVFRGEILIDKEVFEKKYADDFVNPRSFVAGVIGNKVEKGDTVIQERIDDLSIVIYYFAEITKDGMVEDRDWSELFDVIDNTYLPDYHNVLNELTVEGFEKLYNDFDAYRKDTNYNLDGFVIKPTDKYRQLNLTDPRPKDCVAIKFLPMVAETKVTHIEWNLGKSGEYIPNIRFEPVIMDGKQVSKANGFNYGYCVQNHIVKGTKLTISLAGDIIPYIYEVGKSGPIEDYGISELNYEIVDDIHLMAKRDEKDIENDQLYFSCLALKVPGIGPEIANRIVMGARFSEEINPQISEFFGALVEEPKKFPTNILLLNSSDIKEYIGGKNGTKIANAFSKLVKSLELKDIILTCQFKQCGDRASEECAKQIISKNGDFTSMSRQSYEWVFDENSKEYQKLMEILNFLKRPISSFVKEDVEEDNRIPVILTGEPNNYATKGEFLKAHPEYRQTGSWKEVQIVFTNDMNSTTGKMKKAKEKNIEIRIY